MIQPIHLQRRVPLFALLVLALALLASISVARSTTGAAARPAVATSPVVATELMQAQPPHVVQATMNQAGCATSLYVSGDLAGDQSPAQIYAAMCGKP